jgi:RNA polymerase sigma factor (TIGR02999 family)
MSERPSVTELLASVQPGSDQSAAELLPLVYAELRALAGSYLRGERGQTLQPTALVHEAYMKMVGDDRRWAGRDHFMAVAARAMRHVLVDHSRARNAEKRGGGAQRAEVTLDGLGHEGSQSRDVQVLDLHSLLEELSRLSARPARVVEMRLFGGMTTEQMAMVLGVSDFTVKQDWQFARAWLAGRLQERGHGSD